MVSGLFGKMFFPVGCTFGKFEHGLHEMSATI